LRAAIAASKAVRAVRPDVPIIWGGAFPTVCPDATLQSGYVDYAVRAQGEDTLDQLLERLPDRDPRTIAQIPGLSWRNGEEVVHNRARPFSRASLAGRLPYERLDNPQQYLPATYLGRHTTGYQAALGCRFRCTFCGVAAMFKGKTALPTELRLEEDLHF